MLVVLVLLSGFEFSSLARRHSVHRSLEVVWIILSFGLLEVAQ